MTNCNRLLHRLHPQLDFVFPLSAHFTGERYRILAVKHLSDLFESESRDFGVEQDDQDPTDKANTTVEPKTNG